MSLTEILTQRLQGLGRKLALPLAVLATSLSTGGCINPSYERLNDNNTSSFIHPSNPQDYFVLATGFNDNGNGVADLGDLTGIVQGKGKIRQGTPFIISSGVDDKNPYMGLYLVRHNLVEGETTWQRHLIYRIHGDIPLRLFNKKEGATWSFENLTPARYSATLVRGVSPDDYKNIDAFGGLPGQRVIQFQVVP